MNLTYTFLLLAIISCFIIRQKPLTIGLGTASVLLALFQEVIDIYGLALVVAFFCVTYIYFQFKNLSQITKALLIAIILIAVVLFGFHLLPGFHNALVLDNVTVSPLSVPYSMYLNFDKVMVGLVLFVNSELYDNEKSLSLNSLLLILILLFSCLLLLLASGWLLKYIKFDFKVPNFLFIWCVNNLFFVCLAEEVIFRGFVQNILKVTCLVKKLPYLHIFLASLIFGLVHFKGGIFYVILASIAGFFYGLAYEKTKRIACAVIVHFGLNLLHLIFFTYPAAIN